jgi:deoxycytidylate deaminase
MTYRLSGYRDPVDLLALAYEAASHSVDPFTQVGAVLADNDTVYLAYNSDPVNGMLSLAEWRAPAVRNAVVLHPEARLLVQRQATMTKPVLAVTYGVCAACARLIAASQVTTVFVHQPLVKATRDLGNQADFLMGDEILRRAKVEVIRHEDAVPAGPKVRFDGRLWCPAKLEFVA